MTPLFFVEELKAGERTGAVSHPSDKNKDVARMGHPKGVLNGRKAEAKAKAKAGPSPRLKNGYGQDDTAGWVMRRRGWFGPTAGCGRACGGGGRPLRRAWGGRSRSPGRGWSPCAGGCRNARGSRCLLR